MKISYNWLKTFLDLSLPAAELAEKLTMLGLEVERIEPKGHLSDFLASQAGLVLGEIRSCRPHPNADKLHLTEVDVGQGEPLSIVCGAPNVQAGKKGVVAQVGTKLSPDFVIGKRKLRGVDSEGMLCSEKELGLGDDHQGILLLDTDLPKGTPAKDYFLSQRDTVFHLDITPNRGDALSHLGVARDLHTQFPECELKEPVFPAPRIHPSAYEVCVEVDSSICAYYALLHLDSVVVGVSPPEVQERLRHMGLVPINQVVDATNYVLFALGQPLHAFDAAKVFNKTLFVRQALDKEAFVGLDGNERALRASDLVIADGEKPLALAGVMGGQASAVSEKTSAVLLEAAVFAPSSVRKTSRHHDLQTESSFRYERGVDTGKTLFAAHYAAHLIRQWSHQPVSDSKVFSLGQVIGRGASEESTHRELTFSPTFFARLSGLSPDKVLLRDLLKRLDIQIVSEKAGTWTLAVPTYRIGVEEEADVVEELLRVHGYDKVGEKATAAVATPMLEELPVERVVEKRVSAQLIDMGFYEMVNSSLIPEEVEKGSISVLNPSSQACHSLRRHMLQSGLACVAHNVRHKCTDLRLFEWGRVYQTKDNGYEETPQLALFMTGQRMPLSWRRDQEPIDVYDLSEVVHRLLSRLGQPYERCETSHPHFVSALSWCVNNKEVAWGGQVDSKILRPWQIKGPLYHACLLQKELLQVRKHLFYKDIHKYPSLRRDLSLVLDRSVPYAKVEKVLREAAHPLVGIELVSVYEGTRVGEGKKSYALALTFHADRTIGDEESHAIMQDLMQRCQKQLGALIRGFVEENS